MILDLFGIKFDKNDYEFVPYYLKYASAPDPNKYYDFSYLKYKKPQSFYLYDHMCKCGKQMNTLFRNWNDFDCVFDKGFGYTEYHLFLYCAHSVATITNLNMPGGRHLAISCDSQMIPAIPILINYFGKITMFDHRYDIDIQNVWKNDWYDDVLLAHWSEDNYREYRFEQKVWRNFGILPY